MSDEQALVYVAEMPLSHGYFDYGGAFATQECADTAVAEMTAEGWHGARARAMTQEEYDALQRDDYGIYDTGE